MCNQLNNVRNLFLAVVIILIPYIFFGCGTTAPHHFPASSISQYQTAASLARQDLYHEVAPMESLWRISKMYDVNPDDIIKANRLRNPDSIHVGQKLLIPNAEEQRSVIPLYQIRPWSYIVVHHSATEVGDALALDAIHHHRGFWNGLGYHFLIDNGTLGKAEGQIEIGPRWIKQMEGAHCNAAGMNENGIGICLVGNFSETKVPEKQLDSLVFLVNTLRNYYHIPIDHVIRHRDVPGKHTECPGNYFPWDEFKHKLVKSQLTTP